MWNLKGLVESFRQQRFFANKIDERMVMELSAHHAKHDVVSPVECDGNADLAENDNGPERPPMIFGERHSLANVALNISWWEHELRE